MPAETRYMLVILHLVWHLWADKCDVDYILYNAIPTVLPDHSGDVTQHMDEEQLSHPGANSVWH